MKARDFYRILSRTRDMEWRLNPHEKVRVNIPSTTTYIAGRHIIHYWRYSPLTLVASQAKRRVVDGSEKNVNRLLRLDSKTFRRIDMASNQDPGYSRIVRRKLLKACRLPLLYA